MSGTHAFRVIAQFGIWKLHLEVDLETEQS